jgi:hypothetical protein
MRFLKHFLTLWALNRTLLSNISQCYSYRRMWLGGIGIKRVKVVIPVHRHQAGPCGSFQLSSNGLHEVFKYRHLIMSHGEHWHSEPALLSHRYINGPFLKVDLEVSLSLLSYLKYLRLYAVPRQLRGEIFLQPTLMFIGRSHEFSIVKMSLRSG